MTRKFVIAALLAGTAFTVSAPANAAQEQPAAHQEPEATEPDASDASADATIQGTNQVDDLQAKIELLQAQVEALQEALEGVKSQQVKAVPSWKGGPEFADKEAGFIVQAQGLRTVRRRLCRLSRRRRAPRNGQRPQLPEPRLQHARSPHRDRRRRAPCRAASATRSSSTSRRARSTTRTSSSPTTSRRRRCRFRSATSIPIRASRR